MSTSPGVGPTPPLNPKVRGRKQTSTLPLTSLTLGLVALLGCSWIPVVNFGALLLGPAAFLLGFTGRHRVRAEHRVMCLFGMVTGGLAVLVAVVILVLLSRTQNGATT